MPMKGLYKIYNVPAVNLLQYMKYEIIYYKVQYQYLVHAYIVLDIQVVPHARKSL